MKIFNMKRKYIQIIALAIIFILTLYNAIALLLNKKYVRNDSSLLKFISHNTDDKLIYNSNYNLYFIITPLDCDCLNYIITDDFVKEIKEISNKENKKISINYIVSGDFKVNELEDYISQLKKNIDHYYIDKNNKAKIFIYKSF